VPSSRPSTFFTLILIPTLYVMFEEWFPRTQGEPDETARSRGAP